MIKLARIPALLLTLILGISLATQAQMRENQHAEGDLTGNTVRQNDMEAGSLENLFNMQMSHSYSMMFSSFGGQFQNLNAYTNTMQFFFTDRLTGRVDLSLLHSPFGSGGFAGNRSQTGLGAEFIIRNAELNYQINDNSSLHLQFQQLPSTGFYPGSYYGSPFNRSYHRGFSNYGNF